MEFCRGAPAFETGDRRRQGGFPGFIEPCQPSKVARPPSGPLWVHDVETGHRSS
jgi:hypothetical protein